jgi:hypothetical protein
MRLYVDNQGIWNMEFQENETAADFLQRFKTEKNLHFKSGASLQTVGDGHMVGPDEIMLDRDYYLTTWLERA